MDSITQAVLGAAIGESMLGKKIGSKGALIGAIVATIPDLDVVLHLIYSKFEMLSIHRGFSHSIVFSVLGAFLVAFVLSKLKPLRIISKTTLLLFAWLCLFTHMLLDAFTAYGTQLLLPFSNQRVGFDSINVVDPVYTIPMMIGLILSLWVFRSKSKRFWFNTIGLLISSLYLLFTLVNKESVETAISERLAKENITYDSMMTMPVGVANINWYGVAKGKDQLYLLKYAQFTDEENPIHVFPVNEDYLDEVSPLMAEKMRWFAKGFYTVDKVDDKIRIYNLQVDMRGVVRDGTKEAPTVGYFEITTGSGEDQFSSGSITVKRN